MPRHCRQFDAILMMFCEIDKRELFIITCKHNQIKIFKCAILYIFKSKDRTLTTYFLHQQQIGLYKMCEKSQQNISVMLVRYRLLQSYILKFVPRIINYLFNFAQMDIRHAYRNFQLQGNADPKFISHYELKETLGKGAFSKVKRATHTITGQTAAVKIVTKSKLSPDELQMVREEIEVHKQLIHQNICRLYEVQETNNKIYIFMEYCINGDLYEYLRKNGPLQQADAVKIFKQIYSAVKYMHQLGFCHRDIKGQNIVLDAKLRPKIIDFNSAQRYHKGQKLNIVCGSFSYSSPQLLLNKPYNPQKLDSWCLGILFFTILAAQLPFQADTISKIKNSILALTYKKRQNFSKEIITFFQNIFIRQQERYNLCDIQASSFFLKYPQYKPNFINTKIHRISVDEKVLDFIEQLYNIHSAKIKNSVQRNQCNSDCSVYYLTFVKMFYNAKMSTKDINSPFFMVENKPNHQIFRNKTNKEIQKPFYIARKKSLSHQSKPVENSQKKYYSITKPSINKQDKKIYSISQCKKCPSINFTTTFRKQNFNIKVSLPKKPTNNRPKTQIFLLK